MSLIAEIEAACTNSSIPVVDLLRKCKIIAARLHHKELNDWISAELNGYQISAELPKYRYLHLESPIGHFQGPLGSSIKNAPIPLSSVPDDVREQITPLKMHQSIAEIERLSEHKTNLQIAWSGDTIAYFQHNVPIYDHMVLSSAHWKVSPASLKGIVDTVRTRVLDYILAIQNEYPEIESIKPGSPSPISPKVLHQTFNMTIMGGIANVGSGNQTVSEATVNFEQNNISHTQEITNLLQQLKVAANNLHPNEKAETTQALESVETQLKQKKPDLTRIKNYLEIAGHLTKLAPVAKKIFDIVQNQFV